MLFRDQALCRRGDPEQGRVGAAPLMGPVELELNITTQGRLTSVKEFENIVVRATPDGSMFFKVAPPLKGVDGRPWNDGAVV